MKYKIGDWIVFIDKEWSNKWKKTIGFYLYGKIGKIIYIENNNNLPYFIKFKIGDCPYEALRGEREDHCWWCHENWITSFDQLKLKKLLEG